RPHLSRGSAQRGGPGPHDRRHGHQLPHVDTGHSHPRLVRRRCARPRDDERGQPARLERLCRRRRRQGGARVGGACHGGRTRPLRDTRERRAGGRHPAPPPACHPRPPPPARVPRPPASPPPGAPAKSVPSPPHPRRRGPGDLSARQRRRRLDQRRGDPRRRRRARLGRPRLMLHLHGLGHFHPENEISNAFLEELDIGTTDQWILERVGVRTRRTTLPLDYIRTTRNRDPRAAAGAALYTHAEAGRRAAEMAIARAGISRADIGLVVAGSSASDTVTPAEACNIAGALDLDVPAFDVNSACTSFFVHLHLLDLMRPDALPPFVLVVVPEAVTRAVDYT